MKPGFIYVTIIILLSGVQTNAQTWNEWFRQKKTQKKYLVQQIAALKVYLKYLKQGYRIVDKGLNIVGDIKDGNFHSHKTYFESLRQVKSVVASSGNVSSLLYYEELILMLASKIKTDFIGNPLLTDDEAQYVQMVCENLTKLSIENIDNVNDLLTSQRLEMKDNERIERLRVLCEESKERLSFTREFYNSNHLLVTQRDEEHSNIERHETLESL